MIATLLIFRAAIAERLFRERVRKGFDFPQPWQTKERTMHLTASFNLQSLTHTELKSLFVLLIKFLSEHLQDREICAIIIAMLHKIEREIYRRLNAPMIEN